MRRLDPERPAGHALHLARRFFSSLSGRSPSPGDLAWAREQLTPREWTLWERMDPRDQRHTITVARNYLTLRPGADRDEIAAALLHDIGKLVGGLGTFQRVVARLVGPRTERLRVYHRHEPIGADMLVDAGSSTTTVEMVRGSGRAELVAALRDADNAS